MLTNKIWLYSVNVVLVLLEIFLFVLGSRFFSDPWIAIFPISRHDTIPKIYVTLMGFQVIACIAGFVGTCNSKISVLKLFWILMISLVIADVAMINPISGWMSAVHKDFSVEITVAERPNCTLWTQITQELECCPDANIHKRCRAIGHHLPRCLPNTDYCTRPLLQWLHWRADHAALLIYFILLPLKCLVVFVLREDIRRIFFIQEVSGDYDEDEDEYFPTQRFKEVPALKEVHAAPQRLYGA